MKVLNRIRKIIYSNKIEDYIELTPEEYLLNFGFSKFANQLILRDYQKIENAYKRAWENRDFEINKFWTRAAYFWGFIVLIFGVYLAILSNESLQSMSNSYFPFFIIIIGFIFSLGWLYVIKGSKRWQENWEKHIDLLENYISGPLYKTIYHKGDIHSVSKINEILAYVVIFSWVGLFYNYMSTNNQFPWSKEASQKVDIVIIFGIFIAIIFSLIICIGYSRKSYNNKKDKFIIRKPPSN